VTPYHAKYYAYELTRKCPSDQLDKLGRTFLNATIDLQPHQIDAALFAFRNPLSRGVLLADEVGLGKTIEAGLVLSQLWAENRRCVLCIVPAHLREQWKRELAEKFFIESMILETKRYRELVKDGEQNPFLKPGEVIICSYHFARSKSSDILQIPWDLVVIDEAHRLRNVYKKSNKIARAIREVIENRPKALLTATPLQNSLMELYGLMSFIDPHIFGDEDSFREQFAKRATDMGAPEYAELRARIAPACQRTLRRQVLEYIRYTNRTSLTQDFTPRDDEVRLYDAVSGYLQRETSFALPSRQRALMTLVLRKILASSSFAIAATLGKLIERLEAKSHALEKAAGQGADVPDMDLFSNEFDTADQLQEEWPPEDAEEEPVGETGGLTEAEQAEMVLKLIGEEIGELKDYQKLAQSITENAKGDALLAALKAGFDKAEELGAPRKALVFTESRRTQRYLKELLEANGYGGDIVTLSGTNTDEDSKRLYRSWMQRHEGDDRITRVRAADIRSAIVEEFKERASIMIATESGAEGINLQFCNLVVNYDLPWNPQRIEQRIGRCHRYGQEHDVVVINFINRRNAADQRVFELLAEKFRLFDGVFGASDEVLGALESGVDFEKRINEIYQTCRTPEEINAAFDGLQTELEENITARMEDARGKLLENFDEDVHARLRDSRDKTALQLGRFEDWLWRLTEHELLDCADFQRESCTFTLTRLPEALDAGGVPLGTYRLVTHRNGVGTHHYRLGHPLAERLVEQAKARELPPREITFRYDQHPTKITLVENLQGQSGWLHASLLSIKAFEREDYIVFTAMNDSADTLDQEACEKLFSVGGDLGSEISVPENIALSMREDFQSVRQRILDDTAERNRTYFEAEMEKLESWAQDLKDGLERELKEMDKDIKATKKEARQTADLDAKVALHKKAKEAERRRSEKRRKLFEAQDEVDRRKETLIEDVEARLNQQVTVEEVLTVRWSVS